MLEPRELPACVSGNIDDSLNWSTINPIVPDGAICIERAASGVRLMKIGNGTTRYNSLPYMTDQEILNATEAFIGLTRYSTTAESQDDTNDITAMTPKKTHALLADLSGGGGIHPQSILGCKTKPTLPYPFHDMVISPDFLIGGSNTISTITNTINTNVTFFSASYGWSAMKVPVMANLRLYSVTLDFMSGTSAGQMDISVHYANGNTIGDQIGSTVRVSFTSSTGAQTFDVSSGAIEPDTTSIFIKFTRVSGDAVVNVCAQLTNYEWTRSNIYPTMADTTVRMTVVQSVGAANPRNVTLFANTTTPLSLCFGDGEGNVVDDVVTSSGITLPNIDGTHWLYVDRNIATGVKTFGSTVIMPEYGKMRRGVDCLPVFDSSSATLATRSGFGTLEASASRGTGYEVYRAADRVLNAASAWEAAVASSPTLRYLFNSTKKVIGIKYVPNSTAGGAKNFTISTSPDGISGNRTVRATITNKSYGFIGDAAVVLFDTPVDCLEVLMTITATVGGGTYVDAREFVPIFADDWYCTSRNVMYDKDGAIIQRVYVGKAIVASGAVTSVIPFHIGIETYVPVNDGNVLAISATYIVHNYLGTPVDIEVLGADIAGKWVIPGYSSSGSSWHGIHSKSADQVSATFKTDNGNFWWGSGATMTHVTTKALVRFRRGF